MKLSTRSEYAFLALLDLARAERGGMVTLGTLARRHRLSRKYLARIMRRLEDEGLVRAKRGASGGYVLGRPAGQISMAEVVRALDGPIASVRSASIYFYKPSAMEREPALVGFFREIRDMVACKMERTTLRDMLRRERPFSERTGTK